MYRYSFDNLFLAKLEIYLYSNFCMSYKYERNCVN